MKELSAIFLIFLFFFFLLLFSALLSARRCSPAGDVNVKCVERRSWLVLGLDKRIFLLSLHSSSSSSSVVLRYFSGKQRGGWKKRRSWCWFGESNQAKEQRILSKLSSRRLLPERRCSRGRGEGRRLGWTWGSVLWHRAGPGC